MSVDKIKSYYLKDQLIIILIHISLNKLINDKDVKHYSYAFSLSDI